MNQEDEGEVDEYLGVKVERRDYVSYKLSQLILIDQILQGLDFNYRTKSHDNCSLSSKILHRYQNGPTMIHHRSTEESWVNSIS